MDSMTILVIAVVIVVGIGVIVIFNTLIAKRQMAHNGWSDIDVQLKRRADLIPQLVSTVQGYAAHERELFDCPSNETGAARSSGNRSQPSWPRNRPSVCRSVRGRPGRACRAHRWAAAPRAIRRSLFRSPNDGAPASGRCWRGLCWLPSTTLCPRREDIPHSRRRGPQLSPCAGRLRYECCDPSR